MGLYLEKTKQQVQEHVRGGAYIKALFSLSL